MSATTLTPADTEPELAREPTGGFSLSLDNFEGPFDLLLSLIAKHKLDGSVPLHAATMGTAMETPARQPHGRRQRRRWRHKPVAP